MERSSVMEALLIILAPAKDSEMSIHCLKTKWLQVFTNSHPVCKVSMVKTYLDLQSFSSLWFQHKNSLSPNN